MISVSSVSQNIEKENKNENENHISGSVLFCVRNQKNVSPTHLHSIESNTYETFFKRNQLLFFSSVKHLERETENSTVHNDQTLG